MFLKIKWRKKSSNEEFRLHIVLVQNKFLRKMLFCKILWSCSSLTLNSPQPAFLSLLPIFFRRVSLAEYPSTQGLLTLLQEIKSSRCVWPRAAWWSFQKSSMREKSKVYPWAGCIYYYYYQCCIRLPCCYYFTLVCNNCTQLCKLKCYVMLPHFTLICILYEMSQCCNGPARVILWTKGSNVARWRHLSHLGHRPGCQRSLVTMTGTCGPGD